MPCVRHGLDPISWTLSGPGTSTVSPQRRTGARTQRGHTMNGRGRQTRQGLRVLGPAIRCVASLAVIRHATAMQQRLDPALNGRQHRADIVIVPLMRTERHTTTAVGRKHPIPHQCEDVHVQVQRRAKALDDSHGAAAGHPPHRDAWPADAASQARLAHGPRPPPGTARDPTPAGSEDAAAGSGPAPPRHWRMGTPETRDRINGYAARICAAAHPRLSVLREGMSRSLK